MLHSQSKSPLYAAFFCALLTACGDAGTQREAALAQCAGPKTPVAAVQGDGYSSPMPGSRVTVQGIVTLIESGRGFYLEDTKPDDNPDTSEALFVQSARVPAGTRTGSVARVSGTVAEIGEGRDTLTALTGSVEVTLCSSGHDLPLTGVSLPLDNAQRESLEGMRIHVGEKLTVTDVYQLDRGRFTLSSDGIQYVPTEIVSPWMKPKDSGTSDAVASGWPL